VRLQHQQLLEAQEEQGLLQLPTPPATVPPTALPQLQIWDCNTMHHTAPHCTTLQQVSPFAPDTLPKALPQLQIRAPISGWPALGSGGGAGGGGGGDGGGEGDLKTTRLALSVPHLSQPLLRRHSATHAHTSATHAHTLHLHTTITNNPLNPPRKNSLNTPLFAAAMPTTAHGVLQCVAVCCSVLQCV